MAVDYMKDFDGSESYNTSAKVSFAAASGKPNAEFDPKFFDFNEFTSDYSEVLKGQAMIDTAYSGKFNSDIKERFSVLTHKSYDVDFGYDTTQKGVEYFAEFYDKNGDSKPFRVTTDKTVKYGDDYVDNKFVNSLDENSINRLSKYLEVSTSCANMTSDAIGACMRKENQLNAKKDLSASKSQIIRDVMNKAAYISPMEFDSPSKQYDAEVN